MARENSGWGYDRIVGALANLGHVVSDQTVGNILRRYGIAPAPKRSQTTTWKQFIAARMDVHAGADFFTVEVLTWRGLVTYYVLFFLHLETRRVSVAGVTKHPTEEWMTQIARNAIDEQSGYLPQHGYVLHDRDTKFCAEFRKTLATGGVTCLRLPRRSPHLNAFRSGGYARSKANVFPSSFCSVNPHASRPDKFLRALSCRTPAPRQGKRPFVPNARPAANGRRAHPLQRTARRLTEILLSRRMSFLTIRGLIAHFTLTRAAQTKPAVQTGWLDSCSSARQRR
jgi:hypothetical protein